jgi:hypothetical protein
MLEDEKLVEAVARAIGKVSLPTTFTPDAVCGVLDDDTPFYEWMEFEEEASAAIAAFRRYTADDHK